MKLAYIVAVLAAGTFILRLTAVQMQTLTLVALVFAGQALIFVPPERRHPLEFASQRLAGAVLRS